MYSKALGSEGMKHGCSKAIRFHFSHYIEKRVKAQYLHTSHNSGELEFLIASSWQLL